MHLKRLARCLVCLEDDHCCWNIPGRPGAWKLRPSQLAQKAHGGASELREPGSGRTGRSSSPGGSWRLRREKV